MSTDKHERQYQAYQALKGLSDLAADTMKQIAYEQMDLIDWDETCRRHREAFARWIEYADAQGAEDAGTFVEKSRQLVDSAVKK